MNCPPKFVPPIRLMLTAYNKRVVRALKEADDVYKTKEAILSSF